MLKHTLRVLRIMLTIALVGWLISQVDLRQVGAIITSAQPLWLLLAVAIYALTLLCSAWRWQVILAGMQIRQSLLHLLHIVFSGLFFSMFLPSSIGGDVMRILMLAPDVERREAAFTSVLMDRVVGMATTIGIGILATLMLPVAWSNPAAIATLVVAAVVFFVGVYVLFSRRLFRLLNRLTPAFIWGKVGSTLSRVHTSLIALRERPATLIAATGISVLRLLAMVVAVFFASQSFSINASLLAFLALMPISLALTTLPISINGLGLQDNTMVLLLATVGVTAAQAVTLSLFLHAMRNLYGLLGGIFFALERRRTPKVEPVLGKTSEVLR